MGMFGIVVGAITTVVGIVKDDEELVKKGMKRTAFPDFITFVRHHIAQNENQRVT